MNLCRFLLPCKVNWVPVAIACNAGESAAIRCNTWSKDSSRIVGRRRGKAKCIYTLLFNLPLTMNDALVDLRHSGHTCLECEQECGDILIASVALHSALQDLQLFHVRRQPVELLRPLQLQAVLNPAQILIGFGQLVKILAADMAFIV